MLGFVIVHDQLLFLANQFNGISQRFWTWRCLMTQLFRGNSTSQLISQISSRNFVPVFVWFHTIVLHQFNPSIGWLFYLSSVHFTLVGCLIEGFKKLPNYMEIIISQLIRISKDKPNSISWNVIHGFGSRCSPGLTNVEVCLNNYPTRATRVKRRCKVKILPPFFTRFRLYGGI